MIDEREIALGDGRRLHAYAEGDASARLTVVWHHGSPQTGALLEPLLHPARAREVRLISYARPAYGGSTPVAGRDVASAAADVAAVADAYGAEHFAVMGASGGAPHALACGALLPGRVVGVACFAGIAPYDGTEAWFAGMHNPAGLRAALLGREARLAHARTVQFDEASFTSRDWAALEGPWSALGRDAGAAGQAGPDGLVDDDVAFTRPWGFQLAEVPVPVLLVQGGEDRVVPPAHASAQVASLPAGELWLRPRDGHVSVLLAVPVAFDWLLDSRP